jgi:hypothetical protein
MRDKPTCELVTEAMQFSIKDIEVISFDMQLLRIQCSTADLPAVIVEFDRPIGFRVLDEGQLCEYWNEYSLPNGWLWQVTKGGWLALEVSRQVFWANDQNDLLEYFVVGDFCVNVITRFPPRIRLNQKDNSDPPS